MYIYLFIYLYIYIVMCNNVHIYICLIVYVYASGWETVRAFLLFSGGVGWGNNVQLHLHTMVMLRCKIFLPSAVTLDATL